MYRKIREEGYRVGRKTYFKLLYRWQWRGLIRVKEKGRYHVVCLPHTLRSWRKTLSYYEEVIEKLIETLYKLRKCAAPEKREEVERIMAEAREYLLRSGYLTPFQLAKLESKY